MWVAIVIIAIVVAVIATAALYQWIRPPHGKPVQRHQLSAFEAEAMVEQGARTTASGTVAGGGPHLHGEPTSDRTP